MTMDYNEMIEEMLDTGKTPECIYHDVLSVLKERQCKRERERAQALVELKAGLDNFYKKYVGDKAGDAYIDSLVDLVKKEVESIGANAPISSVEAKGGSTSEADASSVDTPLSSINVDNKKKVVSSGAVDYNYSYNDFSEFLKNFLG